MIALLDQTIQKLHEMNFDTVPEILYGYQCFPVERSNEELLCKLLEHLLVSNGLAVIKTLDANSRICAYSDLSLTPVSMKLILDNQSCIDKLQAQSIQQIQVIISCGERNIINTGSSNNFSSLL